MYRCITDTYRAHGFGNNTGSSPTEYPTLQSLQDAMERAERLKTTKNLVARCRPLLEMDIFRPPNDDEGNFVDSLQQGLVIDLHDLTSEKVQTAVGAFLLRKVYREMLRWESAERIRLAIVLDEAHRMAKDITLPKIMKEGRKFGVAVITASQGLADFHPDVLANAGTKIAFRTNHPESRKLSGYFSTRQGIDMVKTLQSLNVGEAAVQTSEMQTMARTRMMRPSN